MAGALPNWQAAVQGLQMIAQGAQAVAAEVGLAGNIPQLNIQQLLQQNHQQTQQLLQAHQQQMQTQQQNHQQQMQTQQQNHQQQIQAQLQNHQQQMLDRLRIESHNSQARLYNSRLAPQALQALWDTVNHVPVDFPPTADAIMLMQNNAVTGLLNAYSEPVDPNSTPAERQHQLKRFLGCHVV
jgi:hypothetical protein